MPIASKDILLCAEELTRNTRGVEALIRTAVARSYYAAYHDCLDWHTALAKQGTLPAGFNERGQHVELAAKLLNPDSTLSTELQNGSKNRGLALRNLHADRVIADYKLHRTVTSYEARTALASARRIIAMRPEQTT